MILLHVRRALDHNWKKLKKSLLKRPLSTISQLTGIWNRAIMSFYIQAAFFDPLDPLDNLIPSVKCMISIPFNSAILDQNSNIPMIQ